MNNIKQLLSCATLALAGSYFQPIMAQKLSSNAFPVIVAPHSQVVSYLERTLCYDITANVDYTVTSDADWISVRKSDDGTVYVHLQSNKGAVARTGKVTFTSESSDIEEVLTIEQGKNQSVDEIPSDINQKPSNATANTAENGHDITLTYDEKNSTIWHSQYSGSKFNVSSGNPAILTYNFTDVDHIDYINYVPRQDGTTNGNFQEVEIYAKCGTETSYKLITTVNLNGSSTASKITLGENGLDTPKSIQFKVLSATGGWASCAEMEFMCINPESGKEDYSAVFTDGTYSALKEGVTEKDIDALNVEFYHDLAKGLLDGSYSTDYRVGKYNAKLSYYTQSDIWSAPGKYYDQMQGTTGISISKGKQVIAVTGLPDGGSVPMKVVAWYVGKDGGNFDGGNPYTTQYTLHNGLNTINYDYDYDGLAYICYYADANPELQPELTVHFINGAVNGYLSPDKTNEEMYELTGNAVNVCMDVVGKKVHSVWTSDGLHKYCKASDGTSFGYRQYMNVLDSLVDWEHYLLGFKKYNSEPDNRTFAYTNYTYYMFQGGLGVSFHHNQESRVLNCKTLMYSDDDAVWGLSHEWGHQHQMHPYFCWAGMSEVTNNMNSYYNIMKMGYHSSDKINNWVPARKHFIKADYTDITPGKGSVGTEMQRYSSMRHNAYVNRSLNNNAALRAYLEEMKDSLVQYYTKVPERALAISEVGVGETLCPFIMLYNYFTTHGHPDFAPDWYEALRQNDNENGSTIEKQDGIDKYELLATTQNGNKNGAYKKLASLFPKSCWVTKQYVNASSSQWENSVPYVLNYIRKVSRLSGYNLFPYFERWGFLRQVGLYIGDYGNKWMICTPEMYNEFKSDMDQLVSDGVLKEMPDGMVEEISNGKDLHDSGYLDFGTTPTIPN